MNNNYYQIFQYKSFRNFWVGFSLSALGDTMTRVALTWFVYETTGSAQALGWLTFFYTGPVIVGGFLAGWLLDRFDRRQVMLVDNLLRAGVVALVPILYALGVLALWHVYAVAAVYGLLMMIPLAGGPALVPALVPRERLATANALEMLSFTLGEVIGPPLAGFLIARIGGPNVVIIDVVSYLVFAFMLTRVKLLAEEKQTLTGRTQSYSLGDAFRLLWRNKVLLSTTLMFMTFNLGFGAMFVWLPIYSDQVLGGGPELYGGLLGFLAVGAVVSSMLAGSLNLSLSLGTLISLAQFLAGASIALLLAGRSIAWAMAGLALLGLFSAPLTIWAQTLRMQVIPEALRGRTFALLRTLMQGANPIGGMMAGWLLPLLGMSAMIGLSALLIGAPGLVGHGVKELREGEEQGGLEREAA
jgi:MFS family permease